jgi:hypothetical protein
LNPAIGWSSFDSAREGTPNDASGRQLARASHVVRLKRLEAGMNPSAMACSNCASIWAPLPGEKSAPQGYFLRGALMGR